MAKAKLLRETYPTVCAGDSNPNVPITAISASTLYNEFRTQKGERLDPKEFDQYVVHGNSMQYCGIYDKDLLFVKRGFKKEDLVEFPTIVVLSVRNAKSNEPKYKVRRAWKTCNINDDLGEVLKTIMNPQNFRSIREIEYYDGDAELIKDFFDKRLHDYKTKYIEVQHSNAEDEEILISTTFHTDENKVRFSIHPISSIMGIVKESFTINKK